MKKPSVVANYILYGPFGVRFRVEVLQLSISGIKKRKRWELGPCPAAAPATSQPLRAAILQ